MENKKYELILVIVNKGTTDLVMNAARKAGSKGGTITGARGTANPELSKFYGISVTPEKEVVFIVVPSDIKDNVMKQIYDEAGIKTQGQGIILSLPITDAVGFSPIVKAEENEETTEAKTEAEDDSEAQI